MAEKSPRHTGGGSRSGGLEPQFWASRSWIPSDAGRWVPLLGWSKRATVHADDAPLHVANSLRGRRRRPPRLGAPPLWYSEDPHAGTAGWCGAHTTPAATPRRQGDPRSGGPEAAVRASSSWISSATVRWGSSERPSKSAACAPCRILRALEEHHAFRRAPPALALRNVGLLPNGGGTGTPAEASSVARTAQRPTQEGIRAPEVASRGRGPPERGTPPERRTAPVYTRQCSTTLAHLPR